MDLCRALKAPVCVVQTPPKFGYSRENEENVEAFFSSVRRNGVTIGWEPRGTWNKNLSAVKKLCEKLELVHVVDPFRRDPVFFTSLCYFRLHGIGKGEVNYRYKYTESDLRALKEKVLSYEKQCDVVYVLFNNVYMAQDAKAFEQMLSS